MTLTVFGSRRRQKPPHGLYAVLGCSPDATHDELHRAYRQKSFASHPDRGGDRDEFLKVGAAWAVLGDPERRQRYDRDGDTEQTDLEAEARSLLVSILNAVLDAAPDQADMGREDIAQRMRDTIRQSVQQERMALEKAGQAMEHKCRQSQAVADRMGDEFLANAATKRVEILREQHEKRKRKQSHTIAVMDYALKMLAGVQYRSERNPYTVNTSSTSSFNFFG